MPKPRCPKCGSEEFEEDMIAIYGMWGEFEGTEDILKCKKCGEIIRKGEKKGDEPPQKES
jgi:uncharacterized Zn finger protein